MLLNLLRAFTFYFSVVLKYDDQKQLREEMIYFIYFSLWFQKDRIYTNIESIVTHNHGCRIRKLHLLEVLPSPPQTAAPSVQILESMGWYFSFNHNRYSDIPNCSHPQLSSTYLVLLLMLLGFMYPERMQKDVSQCRMERCQLRGLHTLQRFQALQSSIIYVFKRYSHFKSSFPWQCFYKISLVNEELTLWSLFLSHARLLYNYQHVLSDLGLMFNGGLDCLWSCELYCFTMFLLIYLRNIKTQHVGQLL